MALTNDVIQRRMDRKFGANVAIVKRMFRRSKHAYYEILWLETQELQVAREPWLLSGPKSIQVALRNKRLGEVGKANGLKSKGVSTGFKTNTVKNIVPRLTDALCGRAEVLDVFPKNGNAHARIYWFETGELSIHDAYSILCGLVFGPPSTRDQRKRATNLVRYGFDNPTKNPEVRLRAAKTANKLYPIEHWKSGERMMCQGLYEYVVLEYLNSQSIDYVFQKHFALDDGSTFTVDLYLPVEGLFIEIKGRWYKDAIDKWEKFKALHPNSEVWDSKKLKSLGLYSKYLKLWNKTRGTHDYFETNVSV